MKFFILSYCIDYFFSHLIQALITEIDLNFVTSRADFDDCSDKIVISLLFVSSLE